MNNIYNDQFYDGMFARKIKGAEIVLRKLLESLPQVKSAADFGCGVGVWLYALNKLGVEEICGYDGPWVNKDMLEIPKEYFVEINFEKNFSVNKKYDLAISLEVAEHIPESSAELFIESLTKASDIVLFSAAIPLQGGTNHFNEQWLEYWKNIFNKKGYVLMDILRGQIWNEKEVLSFYRQNIVLFVNKNTVEKIKIPPSYRILSIVHPEFYLYKINAVPYDMRLLELYKISLERTFRNVEIMLKRIFRKIVGETIYTYLKNLKTKGKK